MKKTILILAAGLGSRYGGIKQLEVVGPAGETILDYSIFDALRAGFSKVIFVIRPDIEMKFKEQIQQRYEGLLEVSYAFQQLDDLPEAFSIPTGRTKPWGTGHALLAARHQINEAFLVINADDYYGVDSYRLAAGQLDNIDGNILQGGMIGFRLDKTLSSNGPVSRGICQIAENSLLKVEETHDIRRYGDKIIAGAKTLNDDDVVSMNMWLFSPEVMTVAEELFVRFLYQYGSELKSEFYLPDVATALIEKSIEVTVMQTDTTWFGMTYREDKQMVIDCLKQAHNNKIYPEILWTGFQP